MLAKLINISSRSIIKCHIKLNLMIKLERILSIPIFCVAPEKAMICLITGPLCFSKQDLTHPSRDRERDLWKGWLSETSWMVRKGEVLLHVPWCYVFPDLNRCSAVIGDNHSSFPWCINAEGRYACFHILTPGFPVLQLLWLPNILSYVL